MNKSFNSSNSGHFAGSVMIPLKSQVLFKVSQSFGKGQSMGFFRKLLFEVLHSSSTRQLWKDLHNVFKRLRVAACTDLTET